ncbi:DUF3325 domain-containing protein [Paraburkholderia denitrificans]|uniref:DUF3325 domain-containing protein n=1 Tax=Paraburkholderia denitrificans TaxID=694025 RepID=A0ABW0JC03_9BURK
MPIYVLFYVLLLCVLAFACLALAMARHQEAVFGKLLSCAASRVFRGGGWSGLLMALWLSVSAGHVWALGLVYFVGCTSFSAGVVYGALIAHERWFAAR